jgi:hypothetical protein
VRVSDASGDDASTQGRPLGRSFVPFFDGDFTTPERTLLERQFSGCRFELIARSAIDDRIALIRWRPLVRGNGRGPAPLVVPPTATTYVVDLSETPARSGGAVGVGRAIHRSVGPATGLFRVDSTSALEARYPGHFPGVQVNTPGWLHLRRLWLRAIPLLIVSLAVVWIFLVLWQARGS